MRHASACDNGHSFWTALNDLRNRPTQRGAALRGGQRRHVNVGVQRNNWNIAFFYEVFKRHGECVTKHCLFGVRDVETFLDQLVEKIFGHLRMEWHLVVSARKFRNRSSSPN